MKRFDQMLFNRFTDDWSKLSHDQIKSMLRVKSEKILPSINDIDLSKPQRVKLGIDATGTDIHIGHMCPIFVLNMFVKLGHHVDLIIGDFTAKIGDPSGRVTERAIITDEQIAKNFATYAEQIGRYIDVKKLHVVKNSTWLKKVTLEQVIAIAQQRNMATIMQREDFRQRMEQGGLTQAETLYGILVGLDSVALNTTIELGGIDQLLNLQQTREVQRIMGQDAEVIMMNPILEGLSGDGRKMSKSYGNYVAVNSTAEDKFGRLMSLGDNLILMYFKCFSYLFEDEIAELSAFIKSYPMEAKKQLATYFVAIEAKNMAAGEAERAKFEAKFSKRELSEDDFLPVRVGVNTMMLDALATTGKFKSKGDVKRLMQSGAIRNLDNDTVISTDFAIVGPIKIKVGKLNFFKLEIK
ncbi:MAG: tyrosine--tRNA ligase [Firmicutes bacterium]|nr:tyrosine--tRNA ligase [Bacillota bacterium]